jgi:hypothetical protein
MLRFDLAYRGDVLLMRCIDDVGLMSDLGPLYDMLRVNIARRQLHFCFAFSPNSFLYSQHLAVLVKCLERVRDVEGTLTILRPSADLMESLGWLDPGHSIRVIAHETELSNPMFVSTEPALVSA